ncbi:MFS transporter [Virgisporangium aliadipatigenens]|uniref:MFS transporter n=1 Tax=Virgisporangium aliadipatigenens TaxID=741659 RepID=UPI001EF20D82|nr:MFS transporter [Virgisporangium aliadipatigenens]
MSSYRRILVALFAAGVATFALLYSTQAVLPELSAEFGVSAGASTLTLSLSTVGLGVTLLVAGPLSEAFGRTRLIHASLTLSGLVALACAVAPGWHTLLALRLLEGITLAGLPAVATAYLREELDAAVQARAVGLYVGGTAMGGMAGRLVSAIVTDATNWRWGLAATAALGLLCALVVRLALPPSRRFVPVPARPRQLAGLIRRAASDPRLLALYAIGCCAMGAFIATFNTLAFRLTAPPYGLSLTAVGLTFLVYPVGALGSAVSGRLADRFGRQVVLLVGCVVTGAGIALTLAGPLVILVAGLAVLTAGFFTVHGVASGWVPARAHAAGVASGPAASLYLVGYYAGSSLFGNAAAGAWSAGGWAAVVGLALALVLMCAAAALRLRPLPTPPQLTKPLAAVPSAAKVPAASGGPVPVAAERDRAASEAAGAAGDVAVQLGERRNPRSGRYVAAAARQ